MTNRIAQDDEGRAVPVMALGAAFSVAIASTSTRSAALTVGDRGGVFVSLVPTAACYVAVGDNTVVATSADHYFEAGVRRDLYLPRATPYLATLRVSGDGTLFGSTLLGTR